MQIIEPNLANYKEIFNTKSMSTIIHMLIQLGCKSLAQYVFYSFVLSTSLMGSERALHTYLIAHIIWWIFFFRYLTHVYNSGT